MPEQSYTGTWWKPETPAEKFSGTLRISTDGEASLELLGGFPLMVWRQTGPGTFDSSGERRCIAMLHGESAGKDITLLNCSEEDANYPVFSPEGPPTWQQLSTARAIVGIHLNKPNDPVFIAAKFRIENLQRWLGVTEFSNGFDTEGKLRKAEIRVPDPLSVDYDDITISATMYSGIFGFAPRRDGTDVRAETYVVLEARSKNPLPQDGFDGLSLAMTDLLTFASGEPCALLSHSLEVEKKDRFEVPEFTNGSVSARTVERTVMAAVYRQTRVSPKIDDTPLTPLHEFLFTCADMSFEKIIPAWLSLRKKIKPATDILLSLIYGPPRFLQIRALTAGVALEGMHRFLYPDSLRMLPADFEQLKERALASLDSQEDRDHLNNAMRNEPTYKMRIEHLAQTPNEEAVNCIIKDIKKWAGRQTQIRNGLAHMLDDKSGKDIMEMAMTFHRSQNLLNLVLMCELGLPGTVQVRAMEQHMYLSEENR
ncbi:HEPN domain-containing protein [Nocardia sp. NPDC051929]|uniref:ApeA N-terminal domain 1-containing protein n=1 Tax=Nocardia sp. NPDC051929 TaxID=3364327 RepID=UPI0037C5B388